MRLLLASAILALSPLVSHAADLPAKAPALPAGMAYTGGSGFYVGLNGGGGATKDHLDFINLPGQGNLNPAGAMVGVTAGWSAWNGGLLYGVEADIDYDFTQGKGTCAGGITCSTRNSVFATQRVVLGAAMSSVSNTLAQRGVTQPSQWPIPLTMPNSAFAAAIAPYITGGIAERDVHATMDGFGNAQQWLVGWVAGAGVRMPLSSNVNLDIHYLYAGFNKTYVVGSPAFVPITAKSVDEQVLRAAVSYHF